jgi:hypothetical protein
MASPPADIKSLGKDKLERKANEALFSSYTFTAVGVLLSIPLARAVPKHLRFAPLVTLGVTGSLLDLRRGFVAAKPYEDRLLELKAAAEEVEAHAASDAQRA